MSNEAMIVSLRVKSWGATRTDKEVGEEVARQNNADADAGRYVKNLVDKSALKAVRAAVQNLRDRHKKLTRVWDDDGRRLIPLALLPQYQDDMETLKGDFDNAVEAFVKEYPGLRDYAQMTLGQMYNEDDYPDEQDLRERFSVEVEYEPVPKGEYAPKGYEDAVNKATARRMKESYDEMFHRIVAALREVERKLKAHDEREASGDKRGRFRLTLLDEMAELVDLLPALNIENDPFLDGIVERMKWGKRTDVETFRDDPGVRGAAMRTAGDLASEIERKKL